MKTALNVSEWPELVSRKQLMELAGVCYKTVIRWQKEEGLNGVKPGGKLVRFTREELLRFFGVDELPAAAPAPPREVKRGLPIELMEFDVVACLMAAIKSSVPRSLGEAIRGRAMELLWERVEARGG